MARPHPTGRGSPGCPTGWRAPTSTGSRRWTSLAGEWGIDLPTLALGGLAAQPAVATVIAGARTPEQLRANVASIAWEPTLEQLAAIDEAAPGPSA